MNTFKVTYNDGSHYHTDANGTREEFTAYLMQAGGIVTDENPETGQETRRQIVSVEQVDSTPTTEPEPLFTNDDIISRYTRAQMLEDGFLIDLNQWIPIKESGYRYPIACTAAVWAVIERTAKRSKDYAGIIWDMFHMSRNYITRRIDDTTHLFKMRIGRQNHTFKIICGPGDTPAPVLTVLLPDED